MYQEKSVWKRFYRQIEDKPWIALFLVALNVLVYVLCAFTGDLLYNIGGISVRVILEKGEIYRMLTSMFLHAGISHLFNNMIILIALGDMLESKMGHGKFLVIYLLSGLGGNICSMAWELYTRDYTYSVGASGAVYGMMGALLGAAILKDCKNLYLKPIRIIFVLGYSVYSGFNSPEVNNMAHIGGLISGFVVYCVFFLFEKLFFPKRVSGGFHEN